MTEQAINAVVGNATMSKVFTKTATDGQWDANTLTDSLSTQQIGILIPNATVNRVQLQYAAGSCAWRIQNALTLKYERYGFGTPSGTTCFASSAIAPYRINPNDILVVYPLAVDSTNNESTAMAWIRTSKGVELYNATNIIGGVSTELKTVVNDQTLGDAAFNSVLQSIHVQAEDGETVEKVEIIDNSGGTVLTLYGSVRGTSGGAMSLQYNLKADGLALPIGKGFSIKVTTKVDG